MRPQLIKLSLWLVASLFLGLPLCAQPWETLGRLDRGARIKVQVTGGPGSTGRFQSASAAAISLETDHGMVSVERTGVRRVQVRSGARRIRRVAIAAAIGVALGVTVDQTLGTYFRNESGESSGARAATYIAPIAVLGAIAGAFPAYRTVYRMK
jgi:hypothetical protein